MYHHVSDSLQLRLIVLASVFGLLALPESHSRPVWQFLIVVVALFAIVWLTPRVVGHPTKHYVAAMFMWLDMLLSWLMLLTLLGVYLFIRAYEGVWWSYAAAAPAIGAAGFISAVFYGFNEMLKDELGEA